MGLYSGTSSSFYELQQVHKGINFERIKLPDQRQNAKKIKLLKLCRFCLPKTEFYEFFFQERIVGLKKTPVIIDGNYYSSLSEAAIENEFSSSTFIKAVLNAETTSFKYKKHSVTVLTSPYKDEIKLIYTVISLLEIKLQNCQDLQSDYQELLKNTIANLYEIFSRSNSAQAKDKGANK